MEEHRFFDLDRWGIAEKYLNKYVKEESVDDKDATGRTYNKHGYVVEKTFTAKNNYFPLPNDEIFNSQKTVQTTLKQNP